jgi:phosphomethylpyrimidine synthase
MRLTEDVRRYAAEQGLSEEAALQKGLAEKSKEFVGQGAEIYARP